MKKEIIDLIIQKSEDNAKKYKASLRNYYFSSWWLLAI